MFRGSASRPASRRSRARSSGGVPEPDPEPARADRAYARQRRGHAAPWSGASASSSSSRRRWTRWGTAPRCLAIEGEPGIGKTRLLRELRERAEGRGHLVLGGSAAEFERDMPFSVWVDALDAYVASQDLSRQPWWPRSSPRSSGRCCRRCARGRRRRGRRRALPGAPRGARAARACSPRTRRSCSCSTTCTGATAPRSS